MSEDACLLRLLDEIGDEVRLGYDRGVFVVGVGRIECGGFAEGVIGRARVAVFDGMRAREVRLRGLALVMVSRHGLCGRLRVCCDRECKRAGEDAKHAAHAMAHSLRR